MADTGRSPSGRAGRAAHEARSGLHHTATIPNAERLLELADECENAFGPNRILDMAICQHVLRLNGGKYLLAGVTGSADDPMHIVPRNAELAIYTHWAMTDGFPQNADGSWAVTDDMPRGVWVRTYGGGGHFKNCEGKALTLPLALCAIGLRMRAASAGTAETTKIGSVHEHAVGGEADETPSSSSNLHRPSGGVSDE